ncbi:MAG TPA: M48 family metallopeptidase [Anaeromyxobacteraceae bacterium]
MTTVVVALFLAFFLAELAIETALSVMNLRHVARAGDAVPAALAGQVDPETARRSRAYTLARGRFGILHGFYGAALTLVLLFSGVMPALDAALARHGLGGAHRAVVFLVALSALSALANLPFSLYGTFVLEQRFGFNRTTFRLWLKDRLKGLLLAALIGLPLLYAMYGFFALTGRAWWLWLFAFLTAVQIVMVWLYPTVIAPLFNEFAPLPEGELRSRLEAMARDAGFRTRGLFVMDASRRSGHSNAYFTGFFRPRIVLFDTLVQQMSVDEAAAVLAHEIGHYQARHVHKRLAVGLAVQLASLWVLSLLVAWPPLFAAFGFGAPSFHAALALASLCGGAFTFFLAPVESFFSRRHEYEADRYSVAIARAPAALRSALVKLNGQNLSNLHPHPWYSAWHYSHPTLVERVRAIEGS